MAAKSATERSALHPTPQYPPQISIADRLLSSRISLPENPLFCYSVFIPDATSSIQPHENIELARRLILSRNASATLLDSMLTSVHIGTDSFMYVFAITSGDNIAAATSALKQLHFDGLSASEASSFSPQDIYPCSSSCSLLLKPCQSCLNKPSRDSTASPASLLPRKPLRNVFSHLLEAVRTRLIDDISEASTKKTNSQSPRRQATRLKGGFLLGPPPTTSDWGSGWGNRALTRPLVYCHLQIHLSISTSHLIIHPILLPTSFLPLSHSLSLPAGAPITLLPHGTPAYFLNKYSGPTSALTKQFQEPFRGLGVSQWEMDYPSHDQHSYAFPSRTESAKGPSYIIAWISVENKQGEDKGITIIYPSRLCLSYISPTASSRQPLNYIPELPAPLQPSPQVAPTIPSISSSLLNMDTAYDSISDHSILYRSIHTSSPMTESLRVFRTLTLSKSKDIRRVAAEVGGYVDAVARDRERERERLKKEREGTAGSSPRLARTTATTPAAPTPTATDTSTPSAIPVISHSQLPPIAGPSQQPLIAVQNFYPSPPQTNPVIGPISDTQTSPVAETVSPHVALDIAVSLDANHPPTAALPEAMHGPPPAPTNPSYDPFGNIDPSWTQSTQPYLGMDIDMDFGMDMGMGFGMDSISGGGGGGTYNDHRSGMDFEDAFTDDDFSFFDRPSQVIVPSPMQPPAYTPSHRIVSGDSGSGLTPAAGPAPLGMNVSSPMFGDLSGHEPPQQMLTPHPQSSPWPHSSLAEGFTPRYLDHSDTNPPDLVPPSPGLTPESHSAPMTPNIHLSPGYDSAIQRPTGREYGPKMFDPIPFASYHRVADGKYAVGKFALPSPPDEEDRTEPLPIPFPSSPNGNGWRFRYDVATDPRIGVVRKLIGVKRKMTFEQGLREGLKMSPAWVREHEDWEKSAAADEEDGGGAKSEPDSEEEDFEDTESPLVSRPSTPPPAYLPLGPSLIHTHFQHSQLLPISKPLRPPGAAVAPTNLTATAPTSVPTPVSPAATMGAASEKSKSLEAAASTVAKEVVENSLWAEAWRARSLGPKSPSEIWSMDVRTVTQLLQAVPSLEDPLDMVTLFGVDASVNSGKSLQILETPMISIGKGDAVIQVLPTALRFWEKLGLGPRGGKKDVVAFVLFEDDGEQRQQQVEAWLTSLAAAYSGKHLGELVPGTSSNCSNNGIVPLRLDSSIRKNLTSFAASLPPTTKSSIVFFIVTPSSTMTLASPILRQIFSALKKAVKAYTEGHILFQFVPEQLINGLTENPSARDSDIEILCYSVYNRILLPVDRLMSRRFSDKGELVRNYFQEPSLALARPLYSKVSYTRAARAPLNVMDRHTLLHVGYAISTSGKWIVAACVDQRGEAHDLGVWLTQTPGDSQMSDETYLVRKVWHFAVQFAKKANIEWRLVFAKYGVMGESELKAWTRHLSSAVLTCYELPMVHVTLLSAESDAPWTFISTTPTSIPKPQTTPTRVSFSSPKHQVNPTVFTDISSTTYALFPTTNIPISLPPAPLDLGLSLSYIPEPSSTHSTPPHSPTTTSFPNSPMTLASTPTSPQTTTTDLPPLPTPLSLLPHATTSLIRVPCTPSPTAISMLHLHLLYTLQSPGSTAPPPDESRLHADITRSFHELAVLADARWRLGVNPILPFHLAAVESMRIALDRDRERLDRDYFDGSGDA